ncbi:NAD-binding Rossmann fold oxidoreductase family protein [Phyllosticta citribraziliensis]
MPDKFPAPQVNIGVVGLGRMGKRHCKTLIYRAPRAKLTAVCTPAPAELEWARKFFGPESGVEVFDSYEKMLEQPGLQAVWVSTSTDLHARITTAAIHKKLHVLCEKPLSYDLEEARAVVALAKQHPELKIMAGYSRRFDASYRSAKAQIDAGTIGRPFIVRSQTGDLRDDSGFFEAYAQKNGAIFVDCTIHDIDLSLWYLGEDVVPKRVFAVGTITHYEGLAKSNDIDNGIAVVEYWDGKMAYFYASRTQTHGHDVATEVIGDKGKLFVNVHPRADFTQVATPDGIANEVQSEYWDRFEHAFATEANEFLESVAEDKPVPVGLELGLKGMEIGWALQKALWEGRSVSFDRQGRRVEEGGQATGV